MRAEQLLCGEYFVLATYKKRIVLERLAGTVRFDALKRGFVAVQMVDSEYRRRGPHHIRIETLVKLHGMSLPQALDIPRIP